MDKAKPFDIPKREVWEAFKKVKANQGAAGVDGQSVADFEADLSNNLYKLWNRMSSGSYFPPPVRRVDIPKGDSKTETRPLGIPTVARQSRPGSRQAVSGAHPGTDLPRRTPTDTAPADRRSMQSGQPVSAAGGIDWVLDIDVQGYFDSIDWELLLKAVRHTYGLPVGASLHRALAEGSRSRWRTVASFRVWQERLRVGSSAPAWRIYSCTMLSTCGWRGPFPPSLSRDTRTTLSATAEAKKRLGRYGMPWRSALRTCRLVLHPTEDEARLL